MLTFVCKQLRPKPRFPDASPPWLIQLLHIDRNTPPPVHHYSTESGNEDGKGIPCPLKNPRSTGDAPDKVERTKPLLREYGFTNTHISKLHSQIPGIFTSIPEKTLLPKLEFLRGIGFSNTDLPSFVCSNTRLLESSLQNQIVPAYNFLKSLPFSDEEDILKTLKCNPGLLAHSLENQIVPCYSFIKSLLLSDSDVVKIIKCSPRLLTTSVEKRIVPCYSFIKSLPLSDSDVVKIIKRSPRLLTTSVEKRIAPNIAALRESGVPQERILNLLGSSSILVSSSLGESIKKATEMGFDPNKLSFVDAVKVLTRIPKPTLDKKMEIFRRCGMSDEEMLMAFRSFPLCMSLAEKNVVQTMDFIVKKMGWLPADLVRNPNVLGLSLEKRIIPRCTVVRYLQGKGILKRSISLGAFLKNTNEKDFLDKFVKRYENDVPGLMDIYIGKISPQEPIL